MALPGLILARTLGLQAGKTVGRHVVQTIVGRGGYEASNAVTKTIHKTRGFHSDSFSVGSRNKRLLSSRVVRVDVQGLTTKHRVFSSFSCAKRKHLFF